MANDKATPLVEEWNEERKLVENDGLYLQKIIERDLKELLAEAIKDEDNLNAKNQIIRLQEKIFGSEKVKK